VSSEKKNILITGLPGIETAQESRDSVSLQILDKVGAIPGQCHD
jgi:hypothetical protein